MKDIGYMVAGTLLFGVIVWGTVTAAADSSDGSNTRNGVNFGPSLPPGSSVTVDRQGEEYQEGGEE